MKNKKSLIVKIDCDQCFIIRCKKALYDFRKYFNGEVLVSLAFLDDDIVTNKISMRFQY